ncbi:GGDEF domain-containing protein [Maridesulfovibrio sp.]|uniref:GGDEF domain-containing protein n=1 Tax=Maridesulfovibrio sp. TaxID=2795000 RepID=UPI0039F0D472
MAKLSFWGEFKDSILEESFQRDKWPSVRFRLLFVYFVTILVVLSSLYSDYVVLGPGTGFHIVLLGKIVPCLLSVLALILLLTDKVRLTVQYAVMAVAMLFGLISESVELLVKAFDIGTLSVPTAVFIVLAYYILLSPRAIPPFIAAVCGSFVYLCSLSVVVPTSSGTFVNSAIYILLANVFGCFFLYTFGRSLRREYAAIQNLKRLVEFDELTGVCSRRKVLEAGVGLFKSARRFDSKLAVLVMDIDHFKKINDEYGHHVGDEVLKETARRCSGVLREVDYFGRLGGEEFVVILPHSTLYDGIKVAERLRICVRERMFKVDESYLPSSVSLGVAELREHEDFASLLQDADEQLYRAKACGRNQVCPAMFRVVKPAVRKI